MAQHTALASCTSATPSAHLSQLKQQIMSPLKTGSQTCPVHSCNFRQTSWLHFSVTGTTAHRRVTAWHQARRPLRLLQGSIPSRYSQLYTCTSFPERKLPPCPAALAGTVHIASARMPPSASGTRQQEEAKQLQDSTSHADSHYFLTVPCRYQDVTGTDLLANKGRPSCCTAERSRAQPEPRHRSQADGGRGGLRLCLEALLGNTTGRRCRCHPCCTIRPRHPQLRAVALRA